MNADLDALFEKVRTDKAQAEQRLRERGPDGYDWEPRYGFTKTDRVMLAAAVEAQRRRVCAYGGYDPCDCKYGAGLSLVGGRAGGEVTGCPELRSVVRMLLHPEDAEADA